MNDDRPPSALDRLAEAWLDTQVRLEPELAVFLGRPEPEGRYGDRSPEGAAARADAARTTLRSVRAAEPADEVDVVTRLELERELTLALERHDARLELRDVANIASPAQDVRDVFDLEPSATAEDWAVIARRLAAVPQAIEGYLATLRLGIERGVVPAVRQVRLVADEAAAEARPDGFFHALAARAAGVAGAPTRDLAAGAEAASAAYGRLASFLTDELAPRAGTADAVGRDHYALASRGFLGAGIDLDETYAWGLDVLARTVAEQEAVARRIRSGAGVDEAIEVLDADPARSLTSTAALRDWMQATSDGAIAALGGHFDIPDPLRRLECRIAPTTSGVIYYTPPSDDFVRPGRMWWSVPAGVTRFGTWRERTTVYHEGVPGHHLQNGIAIANRGLNAWRRALFVSGHGEGWALYAERLMADLGFLDDPGDALGMLDGQRMRAARVVVDLGVHLGKPHPEGGLWDRARALDFLRRHVHMDDAFIRFEVDRYLGWPGQAASYKVGQRVWERVRDTVRAREGVEWDPRAFHGRALALGGVGLDTLERVLTAPGSAR